MRNLRASVLAIGVFALAAPQAQESDVPDLDFLEYLGSWQAEDDEWLAIAEWEKGNPPAQAEQEDDEAEREERGRKRIDDDEGT
jgi:hypothetical protein